MSSVSVVIPCYRYGHFLEDAVGSVLNDQDGVDVRVLVIDDASADGSEDVARDIAARDPRVDVVVHDVNQGNIATFNEGLLDWADGDYCTLISADDLATPGSLRRAADLLDAHPEVGLVYGRALWFTDGASPPAARTKVSGWSVWTGQTWLEHRFRQAENPITTPEVVVRTSLQRTLGGYDPSLPRAADMELFMRFAAHAHVGFIRGADQALHRRHGTNMSQSVSPLMDLQQRRAVFEAVVDHYGDAVGDTDRLSEMVHEQLARESLWAAGRVYEPGRLRRSEWGRRVLGAGAAAEEGDVEELLGFAAECWPAVARQPLYRTLQRHGRLSSRDVLYMVDQKRQWWLRRRLWKYRGF